MNVKRIGRIRVPIARPDRRFHALRALRRTHGLSRWKLMSFKRPAPPAARPARSTCIQPPLQLWRRRHHRQPMLIGRQQPQPLHHVLHRNRVGVEEHGLVDLEQLVVQSLRRRQIVAPHRLAQIGQNPRPQIADRIHQPAGADRHHREAQLLEADKNLELGPPAPRGTQRPVRGR